MATPPLFSFWKYIKNQVNELSDVDSSEDVDINRIIVNVEWDEACGTFSVFE